MRLKKYFITYVFVCVTLSSLTACGLDKRKQLQEVLKQDPAFQDILDEKKKMDDDIYDLQSQTKKRKRQMAKEIRTLKKHFSTFQKDGDKKIKELKAGFIPYINSVEFEKKDIQAQAKSKNSKIKALKNMLKELKELSSKDLSAPQDNWTTRIIEAENELAQLKRELVALQYHLKIVNLKLSFLK